MRTHSRVIPILTLILAVQACSSTPSEPQDRIVLDKKSDNRVDAEFDGKCAMAVANGDFSKIGNPRYRVEYNGKTYLFASQQAKDKFIQNLENNASRAQSAWSQANANRAT